MDLTRILSALDSVPLADATRAAVRAFLRSIGTSEAARLLDTVRATLAPGTPEALHAADRVLHHAARNLGVELSPLQSRVLVEWIRNP